MHKKVVKNTQKLWKREKSCLMVGFFVVKNHQNWSKNINFYVVQHIFWKILKNYFADNQAKEKILQFFIANILVVPEKVVPLHPQSREIATEWKDSDSLKIWNNKNVV